MKAGNKAGTRHFTKDFKDVIMTDDKIAKSMGYDLSKEGRSKGMAETEYNKVKE